MLLANWKELPIFPVMFVTIFLVSGTLMSFILLIASFIVWPFSHHWYRKFSYYCIYPVWSQLVFLIDWWAPSEVVLYMSEEEEKKIGREHALIVMNHSYDVDWLAGWAVCERCEVLASSKVFAKRSLQAVPVIGWLWRLGEIIFLDRNWQKDKQCIAEQIALLSQYENPIWILLYPEGTRFTEAKHKVSLEYAKKEGLPIMKHLLTPRTKGFSLTRQAIEASGNKIKAVYDTTIGFETGPDISEPNLFNLIKGRPVRAHMKTTRIPIEAIPTDETQSAAWLHHNFAQKDQLLDGFHEKNRFEGRKFIMPRRPYDLINQIFWIITVIGGGLYYALTTPWLPWWVLPMVGVGLSVGLHYLVNVTVSKKGSAYGKKVTQGVIVTQTNVKED